MNNAEPHNSQQQNESNWTDLPLFSQNFIPPNKNAAPQISNLLPGENPAAEPPPEINAEPQKLADTFEANSSSLIAASPVISREEPEHQVNAVPDKKEEKENAAPRSLENAVPHKAEELEEAEELGEAEELEKVKTGKAAKLPKSPKAVRRKKPRPKSSEKKNRSPKRIAEPLKMFASPAERADLKIKAEKSGYSLSNYMRLHFELPLNGAGRKKRKTAAAFDTDELNLEE